MEKDRIKSGIVSCLRKSKKPKRKGLVLYSDCMEVYDEKAFKKLKSPEKCIALDSVFHFSKSERLIDGKTSKMVLDVFGELDCINFYADDIDEWHMCISDAIFLSTIPNSVTASLREKFDHVWEVTVGEVEGQGKNLSGMAGPRWLALTITSVFLIVRDKFDNIIKDSDFLEYPLVYISNYVVKGSQFCLKTGTMSATGHGQIWMDTGDQSVTKNIYNTLENRNRDNREAREERERSMSIDNRTRGAWSSRGGERERSGSSSMQPKSRMRALSEIEKKLQSLCLAAAVSREPSIASRFLPRTCDSLAAQRRARFRTVSESQDSPVTTGIFCGSPATQRRPLPTPIRKISAPAAAASLRARFPEVDQARKLPTMSSDSLSGGAMTPPLAFNPSLAWTQGHQATFKPSSGFPSTDSVGSGSSVEDHVSINRPRHPISSVRSPSTELYSPPTIAEEIAGEYTAMDVMQSESGKCEYMTMQSPSANSNDYTPMSTPGGESGPGDDYTRMAPRIDKPTNMTHSRQLSYNLDEFSSYISDSDSCYSSLTGATGSSVPHIRAMSLGSGIRPRAVASIPETASVDTVSPIKDINNRHSINALLAEDQEDRKRAHSVGSGWKSPPRKNSAASVLMPPTGDNFRNRSDSYGSGDSTLVQMLLRRSNTPSPGRSTPLNKRYVDVTRGRSVGVGTSHSEDLMEMDFGTSPIGQSPSGSFGSNDSIARLRTNSFGCHIPLKIQHTNTSAHWCPQVADISERDIASPPESCNSEPTAVAPSSKLIQRYFHDHSKHAQESPSDYACMQPMTSHEDYSLMTPGNHMPNVAINDVQNPLTVLIPSSPPKVCKIDRSPIQKMLANFTLDSPPPPNPSPNNKINAMDSLNPLARIRKFSGKKEGRSDSLSPGMARKLTPTQKLVNSASASEVEYADVDFGDGERKSSSASVNMNISEETVYAHISLSP